MKKYKEWGPTCFDSKGLNGEDNGVSEFYVAPVIKTRDSGPFEESNFIAALKMLGGESGSVQVHRFGHWGPGWFEIILVDDRSPEKVKTIEEIEKRLEDYPLLDEGDFSEREFDGASKYWASLPLSERVRLCQESGCNIFSARHEYIPEDDNGRLYETLTSD